MIHSEASSLTHLFQSDLPDQNLPEKLSILDQHL